MAKQKSKDHAEHIESACNYLDASSKYPDWVITTCFYSSLHYLRHKTFPTSIILGKKLPPLKIDTFDDYHRFRYSKGKKLGRHEMFKCFIEEKCPQDIAISYSKLLELSYSARYTDYNYDDKFVNEAKNCLAKIKAFAS